MGSAKGVDASLIRPILTHARERVGKASQRALTTRYPSGCTFAPENQCLLCTGSYRSMGQGDEGLTDSLAVRISIPHPVAGVVKEATSKLQPESLQQRNV